MLEEKIKRRLARRLQNTRVRQLIAQEIVSLLAEKPKGVTTEDYCKSVADIVVGELKERLCNPMYEGAGTEQECTPEQIGSPIQTVDPDQAPDPLQLADQTPDLNGVVRRLTTGVEHALLSGNLQMLRALGEAIAQRDTGNSQHNPRVTLISTRLAEAMELETEQIQALMKGSFLHDVGKIGIRDDIILKPSGLSDDERTTMNSHPELGAAIIRGVSWLEDCLDVVLYHHEWYDGSGYPAGLKGDAIPVNARIFGIVDVFDALISKRPYKPAYSYEKAMQIVFDRRGSHFDPWMVELFANISRQLYDELAWVPYHVLDRQLRERVTFHFGLDIQPQRTAL